MQQKMGNEEETHKTSLPPKQHDFYSRKSNRDIESNTPRTNDTHGNYTYDSHLTGSALTSAPNKQNSRNVIVAPTPMSLPVNGPYSPPNEEEKKTTNQT